MLAHFFHLAAVSPGRQRALRNLVAAHVLIAGAATLALVGRSGASMIAGNLLLVLGIVEGALLIGWRLTQLPKSQALEFLLVSPLRPAGLLFAEGLVGTGGLARVTFSGLPIVLLMVLEGVIVADDVFPVLLSPWIWGTVTGLALTTWAYES